MSEKTSQANRDYVFDNLGTAWQRKIADFEPLAHIANMLTMMSGWENRLRGLPATDPLVCERKKGPNLVMTVSEGQIAITALTVHPLYRPLPGHRIKRNLQAVEDVVFYLAENPFAVITRSLFLPRPFIENRLIATDDRSATNSDLTMMPVSLRIAMSQHDQATGLISRNNGYNLVNVRS